MSQVSVIIPTLYPSSRLLENAEKIRGYEGVKEVIIVINADQRVLKRAENSTIKVIALGKNKGFTGACNAGARATTGNYLLFLNDDCEMDAENFTKLVEFLENNPELVATQPIVYKQSSEQSLESKVVENVGFIIDTKIGKATAIKNTGQWTVDSGRENQKIDEGSLDFARDDKKNATDNHQLSTVNYLYGLSGTCLLVRKDIFEKIGMWDESFHSYLEDVDLAIRMRKFGYKFAPCLDAAVTHAHMGTSSRMGIYKPMQDMKNWWRLIFKHPDIFVHIGNLIPLLLERARNANGVIKKILIPA